MPPKESRGSATTEFEQEGLSELRHPPARQGRWGRPLTIGSAIIGAVLLKLTCPACWSAYAALLGSTGLPAFASIPYLFPLTLLSLLVVTVSLGYRARNRRGYGPFALGVLGSGAMVLGNFVFPSNTVQNAGIALLIGASIWNAWPKGSGTCSACAQAEAGE